MRNAIQLSGVVLVLQASAAPSTTWPSSPSSAPSSTSSPLRPPRIDALAGYELLANLGLAALGLIVLTAASCGEPSS